MVYKIEFQLHSSACNYPVFPSPFIWDCSFPPLNILDSFIKYSVQFSRSVVSDSLRPHELQHVRPPCPSPAPEVHSNSCPSSQWCHPAISSSVIPFSSCPESLPASVFSNESTLHMRWPKYWTFSFSIIPSKDQILVDCKFRGLFLALCSDALVYVFLCQHH